VLEKQFGDFILKRADYIIVPGFHDFMSPLFFIILLYLFAQKLVNFKETLKKILKSLKKIRPKSPEYIDFGFYL